MVTVRQTIEIITVLALLAGCASPPITDGPSATPGLPVLVLPTITGTPNTLITPTATSQEVIVTKILPVTAAVTTTLVRYTVQPGDTLLGIAMAHGVPMAAIQLQNNKGASIVVLLGEQLEIPSPITWGDVSPYWIIYRVETGDTLSEIAQAYGITVAEIETANDLDETESLYAEQLLILPLQNLVVANVSEPTPSPATATLAAEAESTYSTPAPITTPIAAAPIPPPANIASWPHETVRIMNQVRSNYGLPPLVHNEMLAQAARNQANDCAQRGWCSHTGSDGSDIKQRILQVGYNPASWAECWAQRQTPQSAIDIWMDEIPPNDPHRRTLLTTWLTEIGIGVAKTSWGYYFIADFGKPR